MVMKETSQQKELAGFLEHYSHKVQPKKVNSVGEVIMV